MNEKQIKSAYRVRKKAMKLRQKKSRAELRKRYDDKIEDCYRASGKQRVKNPPKRPLLQEIGNSVTHGLGAVFAIVSLVLMLVLSENGAERISAVIYSVGMLVMFSVSCLYHAFRYGSAVKRLFRRFDYSSIYVMIGATFAPVLLSYIGGTFGIVFFIIQWVVIAVGISLVGVFGPSRLRFIHIPLYVILGWSALMLMPYMIDGAFSMAMWIFAGGVVYSIGIIPYAVKYKSSHFIWHFFVLAGAVVQWIGIFITIYVS